MYGFNYYRFMGRLVRLVRLNRNVRIVFVLIIVISITLIIVFINGKTPEEVLMEKGLKILYTVTEHNELEKINNEVDGNFYEVMDFEFGDICTDKGFEFLFRNRYYIMYRRAPLENKFTVSVKDINLKKRSVSSNNDIFTYLYKVKLKINYLEQDKTKYIEEKGFISITKVNNEWKINAIQPININEIFLDTLN